MEPLAKLEAFFSGDRAFKEELRLLRDLARKTDSVETLKWGMPVYTVDGKNVFGIIGFKNHFGLWFFNGVFLKDPDGVLVAAQEGTKAMRHWKFRSRDDLNPSSVLAYMEEAITNHKKGLEHRPERTKKIEIPQLLAAALSHDKVLHQAFNAMAPYQQREFCNYIGSAKQEKTRQSRLRKCLPIIRGGRSLNEKYR